MPLVDARAGGTPHLPHGNLMGSAARLLWLSAAGIATAAMGVTSCAEPGDTAGPVVRDSAGVRIVENDPARPAWGRGRGWRLSREPLLQVGSRTDDPESQLFRVWDARLLRDGRLAVADGGSAEVHLYDDRGRPQSTLGGPGDGPGELHTPWRIFELPGDSLVVLDLYRDVSLFGPDGSFVRRFTPHRADGLARFARRSVGQLADGTFLFKGGPPFPDVMREGASVRAHVVRLDTDGRVLGSLGAFVDQTFTVEDGMGSTAMMPEGQDAAGDSTLWHGPGDRFELKEIATDGRLLQVVRLDRPPRPVTEEDVEALLRATAEANGGATEETLRRVARSMRSKLPDVLPSHSTILVDGGGHVWVREYVVSGSRGPRRWSVFDPRGRYLGDVVVPAGNTVHSIGADRIVTTWTDEVGVEYVRVYRIIKP